MSYPHGPYHPHPAGPSHTHVYYNRGFGRFRGPSRLIWFGIGGLATYWYMKGRERRHEIAYQDHDGLKARSCGWGAGWGGWGNHQREMKEIQYKMEEEQRNMRGFGASASEAIVDMTEASLDGVMASVVALKSKLAAQKAANEAAKASFEKETPRQV
ncbi:hypothetical protein RhiJN_01321 [Ceratobasidium sp. AG-Ba]|nr:hypothetical protein RhiJN_01321 [Ceratobasidium sp. AG-Ba]QRW02347.1 hypothetical protein RhiLY_01345 [Ceratobasidium sp. AG-Ba]